MALNDVKEITVPVNGTDKAVRKIEDSNGNIIWGSQSAFPYRILEYIDIPDNCYISTNDNGNATTGYYIDANWNLNNNSIPSDVYPFGSIYYNGSSYFRYHLIISENRGNMAAASGSSTFTALFNMNVSNQRHIIELNYHTYGDKKAYCDGVEKGAFTPTSGKNTGVLYIGGRRFNNNGTVTINNYSHTIRLYNMKQKTNSTENTYFYPVQRKSDGKVGLLKIFNNGVAIRFCTTETSTEPLAGPTVQEYFTGTEWSS